MKFPTLLLAAILAAPLAAQADTVRAAVGKPLQQAEALIEVKNYPAALLKIRQAGAVPALTPYESLAVQELRGEAAAGAGDYTQAASAYQAVLASGAVPSAEQNQLIQAIAGFYYQAGDNPDAITWLNRYIAIGGPDVSTRELLAQVYYRAGDNAGADHAAAAELAYERAHGRTPPEAEWQLLATTAKSSGDQAAYQSALQALLADDPRPAYWDAAIDGLLATPDFPDGLILDVYRLRRATGTLTAPGDYEDYAERAILAGHPEEARAELDEGFSKNILTAQTDAGHAQRLRALVAAETVNASAPAPAGGLDQGIADFTAGNKAAALAAFNQVANSAVSAPAQNLARLWAIRAGSAAPN